MALINPQMQFEQIVRNAVSSGKLSQLSPAAQQAFAKAATTGGMPQDPAFRAAVEEASAAGLMPKMTAKDWIMFAAVPAAAFGAAALLGTGAASGVGAASAGTGTTVGATTGAGGAASSYIGDAVNGSESAALGGDSALMAAIKKIAQVSIPVGTALTTKAMANNSNDQASQASPELQQLLALALKRMNSQNDLQNAVNTQAYAGLPTYAKR